MNVQQGEITQMLVSASMSLCNINIIHSIIQRWQHGPLHNEADNERKTPLLMGIKL